MRAPHRQVCSLLLLLGLVACGREPDELDPTTRLQILQLRVPGAPGPEVRAAFDFGEEVLGASRSEQFFLVNVGDEPVELELGRVEGAASGAFFLSDLPRALEAGEERAFGILFSPTRSRLQQATLAFESGPARTEVVLSGTGVRPP
jgi:hypothetical protein